MSIRLRAALAVVTVLSTLLVAVPAPASAAVVQETTFINQHSGKCLEVLYWLPDENARVGQFDCHRLANQQWRYSSTTNLIVNVHTGKCLALLGWSTANGIMVGQQTCDGSQTQQWLRNQSLGIIVNDFSDKCLEIFGWSTENFGTAVQWDCHGGANQHWSWR